MSRDPIGDLTAATAALPCKPDVVVRGGVWLTSPELQGAAIVRSLAAVPEFALLGRESPRCVLCAEPHRREPYQHAEDCPWAMARAWVEAHDLPEDIEPPLYDDGPDDPADRVR